MDINIISPTRYIGNIMELVTGRRGTFDEMIYLDEERVQLKFQMPLGELIVDFYDQLKSRTQGYASLDYQFAELRDGDLVKLDVLVNGAPGRRALDHHPPRRRLRSRAASWSRRCAN